MHKTVSKSVQPRIYSRPHTPCVAHSLEIMKLLSPFPLDSSPPPVSSLLSPKFAIFLFLLCLEIWGLTYLTDQLRFITWSSLGIGFLFFWVLRASESLFSPPHLGASGAGTETEARGVEGDDPRLALVGILDPKPLGSIHDNNSGFHRGRTSSPEVFRPRIISFFFSLKLFSLVAEGQRHPQSVNLFYF